MTEPYWEPLAAAPVGELAYAENTGATNVTGTTPATAQTVVTAPAVTFDGATVVEIEFRSVWLKTGTAWISVLLFEDGVARAQIGYLETGTNSYTTDGASKIRITPTAGTHTYSIRAYVNGGTGQVAGGPGSGGNPMPAAISIRRV